MSIEERTCIMLDYLPSILCTTPMDLTSANTNKQLLKYHFIPTNCEHFRIFLKENFIQQDVKVFVEKFYDDHSFSSMKQSNWKKSVGLIDDNNQFVQQQFSVKTTSRLDVSLSRVVYTETERYDEIMPRGIEIVLYIHRVSYISKANDKVRIIIDFVEFPDGDLYSVYTFQAMVDEKIGEQLILLHDSKVDSKPVRNKITEYLFRYQPSIYQHLETCNFIPKANYYSVYEVNNQEYHPNGIVSRWRNNYSMSSKILSKNLGVDTDALYSFKVNNSHRLAFDHFDKYTQTIKAKLQHIEIDPRKFKPYQENFYISKDLQERFKEHKDIVQVCYQNMFGYYCVDLYVKKESEILYQNFKQEIDIGFIRITTVLPKILNCKNHIEHLLSVNGEMLSFMDKDYVSNPNIVKMACQQNCMSFRFASDSLKNNVEFVTELVENVDGMILQFASSELQRKEDLVLKAVENNGWTCVSDQLRDKISIKTSAYCQRLSVLKSLARTICKSTKRKLSYNAKKCIIEIFDNEKYPPFIMHNKLIPIEIVSKKIEKEDLVLLSTPKTVSNKNY